jgi:hypothetical protein
MRRADDDLFPVGAVAGLVIFFGAEFIAADAGLIGEVPSDLSEDGSDGASLAVFLLLAQLLVFGGHVAFPVDVRRERRVVADDVGAVGWGFCFHAHGRHRAAKGADDKSSVVVADLRAQDALDDVVERELE